MSNNEDYLSKLEAIKAIADEDTLVPNLPMDKYLQTIENIYHWALDDAAKLATIGITQEMLDDLPVRTGACREAHSIWTKDFHSQQEAQKQWDVQSPEAYDLRDELTHSMRYAFRAVDALMNRLRAIADGDGHADMIQDLNDLAVLGKENPDLLSAVNVDLDILDKAATLSDQMADLLAEANGDKALQNESKVMRDKAYTYMKELADEIREAGKFLFWRNKNRYKGYTLSYWMPQRRSTSSVEEEAEVSE
ncbi:hypothetical protein [Maribellus sediminis]|uniref:hypothetical protein n=1 Tax=Maribellus sediminis TaxID=2696285 RepID=UPI00142FD129|nr:hypothetical protein [Maribellus sediminis]